jgi:hypothetical protein
MPWASRKRGFVSHQSGEEKERAKYESGLFRVACLLAIPNTSQHG